MSSDMKDTELDRILGKYAEVLMEHFKRVVVQGDLTVVPAKETLRSELQQLIKRETDTAAEVALQRLYDNAKYGEDWTANEVLERIELALKQQQTRGGSDE